MLSLAEQQIVSIAKSAKPLTSDIISDYLESLPDWSRNPQNTVISKSFKFQNFHDTMAFVNAIAWIAHQADHHPDLEVGYNYCHVSYSTHSIGGLSVNDFICAARIENLGA